MGIGQLLVDLAVNLAASFIGFLLGGWYSKRQLTKTRATDKRELRRKLVKSFQFNIERLKQMHGQLTSSSVQIPDYRLDTESVAHILFHGQELFEDEAWFGRFNWQRFQLVHINSKVDF